MYSAAVIKNPPHPHERSPILIFVSSKSEYLFKTSLTIYSRIYKGVYTAPLTSFSAGEITNSNSSRISSIDSVTLFFLRTLIKSIKNVLVIYII